MIIVGGLALSIAAFTVVFLLERSRGVDEVAAEPRAPAGSAVLIAGTDGEGSLEYALIAAPEEQGGFSVYSIPARTILATSRDGFARADSIMAEGGPGELAQALSDLTGIAVGSYVTVPAGTLARVAERAGTIEFRTEQPLSTEDGEVSLPAGDNAAAADEALSRLDASASDRGGGPAIQALFFKGLLQALAALPSEDMEALAAEVVAGVETPMDGGDLEGFILSLARAGAETGVWPLPVHVAGSGEQWYLEPVPDQVASLVLGSSADMDISLEVRNGTETPGLVEAVAARLAPLRYNISQNTETSGVEYDHTQIRCGSEALDQCDRVRQTLGAGTVIKDEFLDSRKIIVIVGKDMVPGA